MRAVLILAVAAIAGTAAFAQPVVEEKPRFNIVPNFDLYPQTTPKTALDSAVKLLENKRYDYFLAHIFEPAALETRIADRGRKLEATVENELLSKRDEQKRNPELYTSRERLPVEPPAFAAIVRDEAVARSFKFVVRDMTAHLLEYPENVKLFKRFLAEGQFAENGAKATVTLKDVAKPLTLKNNGKRWYLEDKPADDTPSNPGK